MAEIDGSSGQRRKGYVLAGGRVLVKQWAGYLYWRNQNPVTGSTLESATQGYAYTSEENVELDPQGRDVGASDPYVVADELGAPEYTGGYDTAGNGFDPSGGGCAWDGLPIKCEVYAFAINSGYFEHLHESQQPERQRGFNPLGGGTSSRFDNAAEYADSIDPWASPLWVAPEVPVLDMLPSGEIIVDGPFRTISGPGHFLTSASFFAPQKLAPGQTACHAMADIAQDIADIVIDQFPDRFTGLNPVDNFPKRLDEFDTQFTNLYLGLRGDSYSKLNNLRYTKKLNRQINPAYFGNSGFKPEFGGGSSDPHNSDQTHHFAMFFSLGLNQMALPAWVHQLGENEQTGGQHDIALGNAAYELGDDIRHDREKLGKVGKLIRSRICSDRGKGLW